MSENERICPLLSIGVGSRIGLACCAEERCAWWVIGRVLDRDDYGNKTWQDKGSCAMAHIAREVTS